MCCGLRFPFGFPQYDRWINELESTIMAFMFLSKLCITGRCRPTPCICPPRRYEVTTAMSQVWLSESAAIDLAAPHRGMMPLLATCAFRALKNKRAPRLVAFPRWIHLFRAAWYEYDRPGPQARYRFRPRTRSPGRLCGAPSWTT